MSVDSSRRSHTPHKNKIFLVFSSKYLYLKWLALVAVGAAQRACQGDISTYDQNDLVVPFKNPCEKDIQKTVDFPGATAVQMSGLPRALRRESAAMQWL